MSMRLAVELAWRRYRWRLPLLATALSALPLLAADAIDIPAGEIVAASDDGSRRLEAHYQAFRAILIPPEALVAKQNAVIDLALSHGLVPSRIEFAAERNESAGFEMAMLAFQLRGEYADLQKFLGAALASEPALGVAELVLQRPVEGSGISARLRLVLHLKPTGSDRP